MKKIAFLLDTSCISEDIKQTNVKVLPLQIVVNVNGEEKIYNDVEQISRKEVLHFLNSDADVKTSQTPYGVVESTIIDLLKDYDKVYCLPISKHLSGQYNSFISVKKSLEKNIQKDRVIVIDSLSVGFENNWLVSKITKWESENKSLEEIVELVKEWKQKQYGNIMVSNISTLVKGGRLTGVKAILVKVLNLKLMIQWFNGELTFKGKDKKIENTILKTIEYNNKSNSFKKNGINKLVFYSDLSDSETNRLIKFTKESLGLQNNSKHELYKMPSIILAHLGDESFGVQIISK